MTLENWRDIALIVLAVLGIIWVLVLLFATLFLIRKLGPLIETATGTINNIRGTTQFVAETTVSPIIRVLSFIAGVRAAGETFARFKKRKGN